jgi:WD40 repeat protein
LGKIPGQIYLRPVDWEGLRAAVSCMDSEHKQAVTIQGGLRAIGQKNGDLIVKNLHDGPSFRVSASSSHRLFSTLIFSPDGKTLAAADHELDNTDGKITIWDVAPGNKTTPPTVVLRHTLRGNLQWTASLDFFSDNRTLISANYNNSVSFWDTTTGMELNSFFPQHNSRGTSDTYVDCVATSPDGQLFATWAMYDGIKVWERQSLQLLRKIDTQGMLACALAFTGDGNHLIAADRAWANSYELHPSPLPFLTPLGALAVLLGRLFWRGSPRWRTPLTSDAESGRE